MRVLFLKISLLLGMAALVIFAINNSYIQTNPPNNVTNDNSVFHWEPSTAVGGTWVHSYAREDNFYSFTAIWNGQWVKSTNPIVGYCGPGCAGDPLGDVYLSYDAFHARYVVVGTGFEINSSSLYFGTSTDGLFTGAPLQEIFSGPNLGGAFDYGSVAVDSNGRVIVGAVKYYNSSDSTRANGYWINISPDGGNTWLGATEVVAPTGTDPRLGINSRVVAAGNQFYVFTPTLLSGPLFQPTSVSYYAENGGSWSGPNLIMNFAPPLNNSPAGTTQIYYAPLIDASGNSSGTWAVTFQVNVGGYNQVMVCNAQGCWYVNPATDDEFMNGVSVGPEGGLWVSYLTYSSVTSRQLPLYHQTIYLPPGGGVLGATGDYNVDPTSWFFVNTTDRCSGGCYAMGDYARIGSNSYQGNPGVGSPYMSRSGSIIDMFQIFGFDPQGQRPANTFTPVPIHYPLGSDLRGMGKPNPPGTLGIAPEKRRKMPGRNH